VPTTAAALLAMQDRRAETAVRASVTRLRDKAATERSAVALAMSIVCLRLFGEPVAGLEDELIAYATGMAADEAGSNFMGVAMALYALSDSTRPAAPFVLA
jgi:hypothetical protein